jgi:hypothetical protein
MSAERHYAVGLPVAITVHEDGRVEFDVDLSEAAESIWDDMDADERYEVGQITADEAAINAACDTPEKRNFNFRLSPQEAS